ncbi:hypothetical protein [Paeniglutamicibacter antarcticus]|uniref:hypothetical protein n=1 Tax=Paeniglutamicibacter antarcticus TaxID=494023 RepID=UPI0031E55B7B
MKALRTVPLDYLFFRMLRAGIAVGALLGVLACLILIRSEATASSVWLFVGIAAFIGGICAVPPVIGATVAMSIDNRRRASASGVRQTFIAGFGALVGALVPALTYLSLGFIDPETIMKTLGMSTVLLAASFIAALSTFAGILWFLNRQDQKIKLRG